jgi:hypothetical protein
MVERGSLIINSSSQFISVQWREWFDESSSFFLASRHCTRNALRSKVRTANMKTLAVRWRSSVTHWGCMIQSLCWYKKGNFSSGWNCTCVTSLTERTPTVLNQITIASNNGECEFVFHKDIFKEPSCLGLASNWAGAYSVSYIWHETQEPFVFATSQSDSSWPLEVQTKPTRLSSLKMTPFHSKQLPSTEGGRRISNKITQPTTS